MKNEFIFLIIIALSVFLPGCFIETGGTPNLVLEGNISTDRGEFRMVGFVEERGGDNQYENISIELYSDNGTLLHEKELGTIRQSSDRLRVNVSYHSVPEYIIIDSPSIWDGNTEVTYYTRYRGSGYEYQRQDTTDPDELPVDIRKS